jgi:hypothetical protein
MNRKKIYFFTLLLLIPILSMGQVAKYKAVFTLNFIRYVGWPESSKQGDFIIGVVRGSEVAGWLKDQSEGKPFGHQSVIIKEFRSVEEIENCNVIYVSSSVNMRSNGSIVVDKAKLKNSLIITESEGATQYGAAINFVVRDDVLKYELHKANAARMGLQFSSRLEIMAAAINL